MAASNIAKLFKAFPDLDEDAIKLMPCMISVKTRTPTCVVRIRIEGYKAIVRMSEEQPRLLERNVDALVQLLQSVGNHVLMLLLAVFPTLYRRTGGSRCGQYDTQTAPRADSEVTLGVLCDQIEPSDDSMEDEDKIIRRPEGPPRAAAGLRAWSCRAGRCADRHPHQGRIQNLRGGRGEDILLFLPSFNDGRPTRRGKELVHLLLSRAASALREDLAPFSLPHPPSRPAPPSPTWKYGSRLVPTTQYAAIYPAHHGQPDAGLDDHIRLHPTSLRRADVQPTHVSGFGRNMSDGPIVWPLRGADGEYNSLAFSQHKVPYEATDPHPPFTAKLSITDPYVTVENPQMAFTRNNIIWAFSRTPPGSADSDVPISIHHKIGRGMLSLTRIPTIPAEPPVPLPPPPPVHPRHSHTHPEEEDDHDDDEKAEDEGESHDDDDDAVGGGSASFVHGALCTVGILLVLPSGNEKSQGVPAAPPASLVMHLAFPVLTDRSISSPGRWEVPVLCCAVRRAVLDWKLGPPHPRGEPHWRARCKDYVLALGLERYITVSDY
ncbi:hypothetical protein EDB84DRAFT_1445679 [Lactarius hengduanensis]|nr:hypothetical protein EDB84DRAFT_1445679 [Lactarius hengduanensis]